MLHNVSINRVLWFVTSALVIFAAGIGIANPGVYDGVVNPEILPGVFTQDLLAFIAAVLLLIAAARLKEDSYDMLIISLGIQGFFFYAYGIYSIEQVYNWLYPIYLAIFGLSLYSMVVGFSSMRLESFKLLELPQWLRYGSSIYGVIVAVMFNFIWFSALIPLLRAGDRIEFTFSIFIIDLCFIMPGFVISAVLALRNHPIGELGLPTLYILGIGILSPLALAEIIKPSRYGMPVDTGQLWLYLILSTSFMILAVLHLRLYRKS